jgi:hypothetical protein
MGASFQLTENVTATLAWMHAFRNSIEGPILQIPNSTVRLDAQVDTLWAGFNIKFGGRKRNGTASAGYSTSADIPPPSSWSGPIALPPLPDPSAASAGTPAAASDPTATSAASPSPQSPETTSP